TTDMQGRLGPVAADPATRRRPTLAGNAGPSSRGEPMTAVQGSCDAKFKGLSEVFAAQIESGEDLGASLALTIDGEMLVDQWGGWFDEGKTKSWEHDTIVNVWSTTKTMTNLCALMLVDRGQLDVYEKVAAYW